MDKKKKKIVAGAIVVILLAVVAVLVFFLFAGDAGEDELQLRHSFEMFSRARASGNKGDTARLISMKFNDAGMDYKAAIQELGEKAEGYSAEINTVNLRENQADISYSRKMIKDGKQEHHMIINEIWMKEEDANWRLFKLSKVDKQRLEKERERKKQEDEMLASEGFGAGMKADEVEKIRFYSSVGKRDPFESLIIETPKGPSEEMVVGSLKCDPERSREFLEGFDLMSLSLVGIVRSNGYMALVETPNGNGYTVRTGMHIGRNCGKVVKITPDTVTVAEKFVHPRSGIQIRNSELTLKKEEN